MFKKSLTFRFFCIGMNWFNENNSLSIDHHHCNNCYYWHQLESYDSWNTVFTQHVAVEIDVFGHNSMPSLFFWFKLAMLRLNCNCINDLSFPRSCFIAIVFVNLWTLCHLEWVLSLCDTLWTKCFVLIFAADCMCFFFFCCIILGKGQDVSTNNCSFFIVSSL